MDFYLKVGLDFTDDLAMVAAVRVRFGSVPRLRLDANGSWSIPQALKSMVILAEYDIDFIEQPVRDHPGPRWPSSERANVSVAANEGLWSEADAYARIAGRGGRCRPLQPLLGRLIGRLSSSLSRGPLAGITGLQTYPRRTGYSRGGLSSSAAHPAQSCDRQPADRSAHGLGCTDYSFAHR